MPFNITINSPEWIALPYKLPVLSGYCDQCNILFWKKKENARNTVVKQLPCFCSVKCWGIHQSIRLGTKEFKCKQCGKLTSKHKHEQKPEYKNTFCSQSCSSKYTNANRKFLNKRSYAEKYLCSLIKQDFTSITLLENNRSTLPSHYEIDILLKDINLAIELNGPWHYFPLCGQEILKKQQDRDIQKQIEIQQLGITLIVLNTSKINGVKKNTIFIDEQYKQIKQIIIDRLKNITLNSETAKELSD